METAVVKAFVTDRTDEQVEQPTPTLAVVPLAQELTWRERFPGTAAALDRINGAAEEKRLADAAERKEASAKAEARRVQKLTQSKDGRLELAAVALKQLKEREAAAHAARIAGGKGSAATEENKRKRAGRREAAVAAAQANKAANQPQGRGGAGGGGGKKK